MSYSFPGNHIGIFKTAGYEVRKFNYWDERNLTLDWASLKSVLMDAPEGAVFVLHGVAHNPTGCDPTQQQWMEIAAIMKVMMMGVVCPSDVSKSFTWYQYEMMQSVHTWNSCSLVLSRSLWMLF